MRKALYLGLDPKHYQTEKALIHCPLIQIVPRTSQDLDIQKNFSKLPSYSHILITSKSALKAFIDLLPEFKLTLDSLIDKQFIAVGKITASHIEGYGLGLASVPLNETSEGLVSELLPYLPKTTNLLWPHSSQSRLVITDFLKMQSYRSAEFHLYDTITKEPRKDFDLSLVDEIIFTSPSTVDAYLQYFGSLPKDKILTAIGPVTEAHLNKSQKSCLDYVN